MITAAYIASAFALLYILAISVAFKVPPSISESYYLLPKGLKWLFGLFCVGTAFGLAPCWFEVSIDSLRPFVFLSVGGLMFVGAAPLFKEEFTRRIHFGGALASFVGAFFWMLLTPGLWPLLIGIFLPFIALAFIYPKKALFWIEVPAFLCPIIALLIITQN